MAEARIYAAQESVGRTSDGEYIGLRGTRDGALIALPWIQACIWEGLGFSVGYGAAANEDTDPGTFGAGGADLDEFDMLQTLPANGSVGIIPILFKPVFEDIGTVLAVDILLCYGSGGIVGANSVSQTPVNLRSDSNNTSACTVAGLGDDGGTVITIGSYIYREGGTHLTGIADTPATLLNLEWSAQKVGYAPVIVGASRQVAAFLASQAGTGYITYQWLELPAEAL